MPLRIGTHDGRFHADEVLAVATLRIVHPDAEIVRTRDEATLATCDLRVDVGRKYDPSTGDFDHHQGGAGTRKNGIQFSSFGLVWKAYGVQAVGGNADVARFIEDSLVQSVDANDNGQKLSVPAMGSGQGASYNPRLPTFGGATPFEFVRAIDAFNLCWDADDRSPDEAFREAVEFAKQMLVRLIKRALADSRAKEMVRASVAASEDPRLVVLRHSCPWQNVIVNRAHKVLFVIMPGDDGKWRVQCVPKRPNDFENRKALPAAWQDLDRDGFIAATGVPDAHFVHQKLFMCVAGSFEGALALAKLALAA